MAIEGMCYAQVGYVQNTFLKGTTVHFLKAGIHSVLLYFPLCKGTPTAESKSLRTDLTADTYFRILIVVSCIAASLSLPQTNTLLSKVTVYS